MPAEAAELRHRALTAEGPREVIQGHGLPARQDQPDEVAEAPPDPEPRARGQVGHQPAKGKEERESDRGEDGRRADRRWVAPTPMMEPVMVWVVLTGMPPAAVPMSISAPAVSAQNPPTGRSLVSRIPMVLTIRQPPARVPSPI